MNRKERWFSTIAFITGVLPLLIMAFVMKILPPSVPLVTFNILDEEMELASKYNNLIAGLFCIVPVAIVLLARYIKNRSMDFNVIPMLAVAFSIGALFSGVVLYGVIRQIMRITSIDLEQSLRRFDYIGFISLLVIIALSMTSNILRYKRPGSRIAINNRYTRSSDAVWKITHMHAANILQISFVIVAIPLAFLSGWRASVLLVSAIVAFSVYTYIMSYFIKQRYVKRHSEKEAVTVKPV